MTSGTGARTPQRGHPAHRRGRAPRIDSVWTAESWGSDALTPLPGGGSASTKLRLGTNLNPAVGRARRRPPRWRRSRSTICNRRFVLGLVSRASVVEGWYGQPFPSPAATREYVSIIRPVLAREVPRHQPGTHYPLPHPAGSVSEAVEAITTRCARRTDHPRRGRAKNVALAAEIADGWFPCSSCTPRAPLRGLVAGRLRAAPARAAGRRFRGAAHRHRRIDDDVEAAADSLRPVLALYVGRMGGVT